jgi:hypothetical protein
VTTGVTPQVSRAGYLTSNIPIAVRVHHINAAVADGYASCADFNDNIVDALKHYASAVIMQEVEPETDW